MLAPNELNTPNNRVKPLKTVSFNNVNKCIYCASKENLSTEHIIPFWFVGGHLILKGSCDVCRDITGRFEGRLSNTSFYAFRKKLNFQSRSDKKNRKENIPAPVFEFSSVDNDGNKFVKMLEAHQLPPVMVGLGVPRAGILSGRVPLPVMWPSDLPITLKIANLAGIVRGENISGSFRLAFSPTDHMRMAAKIAHGFFSVAEDRASFEPLLAGSILTGHYVSYFAGCAPFNENIPPHDSAVEFSIKTIPPDNYHEYLIATIHLFAKFGGPIYEVVTARRKVPHFNGDPKRALYIPDMYGKEGKFGSLTAQITVSNAPQL